MLFVCQGNICRSPFAEYVARAALEAQGLKVPVTSAGLGAVVGAPSPRVAIKVAASLGVDISEHRGRQLEDALIDESQTIIVMSRTQAEAIEDSFELRPDHRIINLADCLPGPLRPSSIADPFRAPEWAYLTCYKMILDGVGGLISKNKKKIEQ